MRFRSDATPGTIMGIKSYSGLGKMPEGLYREIRADEPFELGDMTVKPFAISHDANEPSGYRLEQGGKSVAVATDLGKYDSYTVECLRILMQFSLRQTMTFICWKSEDIRTT